MQGQQRRGFLRVLTCASAGAVSLPWLTGCGGGGGGEGQAQASGPVEAGNVANFGIGDVRVLEQPVVLLRDASGLYAMSTICTHRQCDMRDDGTITATRLDCDCHGSAFAANGSPIAGPARGSLVHFLVEVDAEGELTVQADQTVDSDERLVVM